MAFESAERECHPMKQWHPALGVEVPRLRTIVIDDSPSFLEVVCALLERDNELDIVARGRNGKEAIELVAKLNPDLVLMDVAMPQLDGLTAALLIACSWPDTRVVLMSAEDSPELRLESMSCGAEAFVPKPRFREDFPSCLKKILTE
ncbi:MAG TPA: response regulator transcription factor [Terriglobales bacterium]|nr:response regulator transcription factor [Terriglobales bacterium]